MGSFVFLIFSLIHLSRALVLPLNSTILQLSPQDTPIATGELKTNKSLTYDNWPVLPYQRAINDELIIRITEYGNTLVRRYEPNVLKALFLIRQVIDDAGAWTEVLEEITIVGRWVGGTYTEVGFYSLHPPAGITRSQAGQVLELIAQLLMEFDPPKEIPSSMILTNGNALALFRFSLAQRRGFAF